MIYSLVFQILIGMFGNAPGVVTFTEIQGKQGAYQASGTTFSVTLDAAPTTGNAVVCGMATYDGTLTVASIQDGASNSYTITPHSPINTYAAARNLWQAYLLNAPSNATATITVTMSGSVTYASSIRCEEFHRSSGVWAFDTDTSGDGVTNANIGSPIITPAGSGELLYAFVSIGSGPSISSADSPWIQDAAGFGDVGGSNLSDGEYILSSASGGTAIAFSVTPYADTWNALMLALK